MADGYQDHPTVQPPTDGLWATSKGAMQWLPNAALPGMTVFNVLAYGAKGDGVADDTTAIQNTINAAVLSNGAVYLPPGTFKLTAALNIPFYPGFQLIGRGPESTILLQATDNTPIIKIANNNTHSFRISGFQFNYANQQPSTNTAGCAIYFVGDSASTFQFYNGIVEDCYFFNCCDCIGADSTTKFSCWGHDFRNLRADASVTRSFFRAKPSTTTGHPNNSFRNIYLRADNMIGPIFACAAHENTSMDSIEVNLANQSPTILQDESGGSYSIGSFKIEGGSWTVASTNRLFDLTGSVAIIQRLLLSTATFNGGAVSYFLFDFPGGVSNTGLVFCHELFLGTTNTVTTGTFYVSNANGSNGTVEIGHISGQFNANMFLTNVGGGTAADGTRVNAFQNGRVSGDKGDADYTVAFGDPNIISYETTLTAARTVTLPRPDVNVAGTHVFNGLTYRIVRSAGGAFALNINQSPATALDNIPASTTGVIEFTYRRTGGGKWVKTLKTTSL